MKTKLALTAFAAAIAVFSQGAFAQASAPAARAEVKAGAQAKAVTPAGEKPSAQPSTMSDKSRADRKETTKADKASGNLKTAGEAASVKEDKAMKGTGTETTRAERKATTKAANKAHEIPAAGEAGGTKGPGLENAKKP
jgi:hypothetical protein